MGIGDKPPADIINGRMLLKKGFKPGSDFGEIIRLANRLSEENLSSTKIFSILKATKNSKDAILKLKSFLKTNWRN